MHQTVAILGRPNVGKSTLFNRLTGRQRALVDDAAGTTRDRREGDAWLGPLGFRVVDTAGLEEAPEASLAGRMSRQSEQALATADVALLLIDARVGITPVDRHFADLVRRHARHVVLVANKCEGRAGEAGLVEAYALGLGDPVPISAQHGDGLVLLYDALAPLLEPAGADPAAEEAAAWETAADDADDEAEVDETRPLRLAVVGRPNAGKSTLINRLLGEERMLTGPEPGITRDAIAVPWRWRDRPVLLWDTAGMRRRTRVAAGVEQLSVSDAIRALKFAEVAVLLVDAELGLERQDLTIAELAVKEGRALVIAANKWDRVEAPQAALRQIRDRLQTSLPQVRGLPLVTLSAATGRGVERLMPEVLRLHARWSRRVATAALNRWLAGMLQHHPPPLSGQGRRLRLRYMTQVKARPPTFVAFCNLPEELPEAYLRYMQHGLREAFDMPGVPVRILLRKQDNPYAGRGGRGR